jgi:hypothetical protein
MGVHHGTAPRVEVRQLVDADRLTDVTDRQYRRRRDTAACPPYQNRQQLAHALLARQLVDVDVHRLHQRRRRRYQ